MRAEWGIHRVRVRVRVRWVRVRVRVRVRVVAKGEIPFCPFPSVAILKLAKLPMLPFIYVPNISVRHIAFWCTLVIRLVSFYSLLSSQRVPLVMITQVHLFIFLDVNL